MRLLLFSSNLEGAQAKRLKLDETSSVLLVVRTTVFFERGETIVVESVGSLATDDDDVALVELGAHRTGDVSEHLSMAACIISRSGENQKPL